MTRAAYMKPSQTELYNLKSAGHPGAYIITKLTENFDVESSYICSREECACPRGEQKKLCRHRQMLGDFLRSKHVDDGYLLDYRTRKWQKPPMNVEIEADDDNSGVIPDPVPNAAKAPEEVERDLPPPMTQHRNPASSSGAPSIWRRPIT